MAVLLPVGTRKGLFLLRSDDDRKDWELEGPLLPGWPVYHAIVDPRDGVLYAAMPKSDELIEEIRDKYNVHLLTGYALELAGAFHAFYKGNRVVGEDEARSKARLRLVEAVGLTLRHRIDI
jgi:arginyl-tRNA synthetase